MVTRSGYVYNANTAEGLQRQRDRGVAKPSLALEDMMARSVAAEYRAILSDLAEVLPGEVLVKDAEFIEAEHPRDPEGRFSEKEGGTESQELPPMPPIPDEGTFPAIRTDDGSIYVDTTGRIHVEIIKALGIPIERITSGGWIVNGDYRDDTSGRSDTMRYVEREKAHKRVIEKRKQKIPIQVIEGIIKEMVSDASPSEILAKLRSLQGKGGVQVEKLRRRLNALLVKGQNEFFKRFLNTIDPRTRRLLVSMSVDKEEAFKDRLARLRTLYLDDAVKRVEGETDLLKKRFLKRLVDWAEGRTERLEVSKLMDEMAKTSVRRARFFARDQFSKFNKALTIASFQEAEAPYVEVITVGDGRVRPSHRLWNHKLFTVEGLMRDPRYLDYLCRCGFVPRYSKDGKRVIDDELAPETKEQAAWLVRSVMAETSKDLDKQLQFSFDFLGETLSVFTVNGDFVRKAAEYGGLGCQNFTMGMNGYAAREPMYRAEGWCFEDEICLHNLLSPVAFLCTLVHEAFERWAMKWLGMLYDDAHERYGNVAEKAAHMILEAPEWRWQE